jgi:Fe-S cluster assembly iron-binding protein IscA
MFSGAYLQHGLQISSEVIETHFGAIGRMVQGGRQMNRLVRIAWFLLAVAVFSTASLASVSVSLAPATIHVPLGGQVQFTATVGGTSNSVVIWSLNGINCSGNTCGQISGGGLYLAPATAPPSNVITVTATSLADLSASASASVILGSTSDVVVSVSPAQTTIVVGQQQRFLALVSGTTITGVSWQLTGVGCSGSACGTLTTDGLYTAPSGVPTPPQVTITAVSVADPAKSGSAAVTIAPPVAVSVSPAAVQVTTGTQKQFTAAVTGTSNTAVSWSLAGSGCTGAACGTISSTGLYTAPSSVPSPQQVSVTATSVADPTKSSTATVTIIPPVVVTVSPSTAQVVVGAQQQFTRIVTGTSNTAVSWSLTGSGCTGAACGTISSTGLYTAPSSVPTPPQVSVTATSVADPTKSATASVTVIPPVAVTVSPSTAQVLTGASRQFTATITGSSNTTVSWSLAGSGCTGAACGTISSAGLYTAPSSVPTPPQISVTATSEADPTKSATASVTIIPPVAVTVSPSIAQVITGGHQQFTATVTGSSNTAVLWSLAGSGCTGTACGTISSTGLYIAPASAPVPNQVTITATSVADGTKSAHATVSIVGPVSISIAPVSAQVVIGSSRQFSTTVSGTSNINVSWSVAGAGCSGTTCGTISPTGLYFAPAAVPNPAQVFVTATSLADATKSSTATVTIIPPIAVTLSPTTATLTAGGQQQFKAVVTGSTNTGITWSVSGNGCIGAACGVISPTGLYTAPASVPSSAVIVKAASVVDPSSFRTATVTIIPPIVVSVSPATAELVAGTDEQFTATVTGTANQSVTWSFTGKGCSGLACGTITSTGFYGAPGIVPNPNQVTVTATSTVDPSKSGSATVTILPPVAVTISPSSTQVVTGGRRQFIRIVTGTTDTRVNWSVTGTGCSGSACGTISSSGLYIAPATIPSPPQVTVKATSVADNTKSASAIVTVIPPVLVTISPTNAVVATNNQQQFRAIVAGSTNTSVDWSLSGASCSGSACGSITSGGLYTAPATVPSLATVIVKATSQIDVSESASAIVSIVANQNSKLQGQYAFEFTGFDASGVYESVGSFTADGNGNITSGEQDVNNVLGPKTSLAVTGKYHVSGENRGTLSLVSSSGSQTFSFSLNSAGTSGRFIEFDGSGIRGSGILEQQDSTAFSVGALKGPYVLSLAGKTGVGTRIGTLAIFDFDGSGNIVGGSMDVNEGGTILPTFASFQGIYRVDSSGRGIVNLSIPGFAGGALQLSCYVVSANKLLLVSTQQLSSSNPILGGVAELQSGAPYLASSFNGPTIFSLSGESGNITQVLVGRISFDGISQPLVEFDQNTGGAVTTGNVLTGAYSVGLTGTGTLNLDNSNGATKVWDIYAIAPNHAYLMDASSSDVGMGELQPQLAEEPFANTSIVGSYLIGSGEPLVYTAPLASGVANFDGVRTVAGIEDISSSSALSSAQPLIGSYSVSSSLNDGRGTMLLTTPTAATYALWVTSASEVLGVEIDSSNPQPVVLHLEQ